MSNKNVDYIVVGGGSAGCVVANRLSEDPSNDVMLWEAGGTDWNPMIHLPLMCGVLYPSRINNWFYKSQPDPNLFNREIFVPRGKVMGGSSSINGMVYIRGHQRDYDIWRQAGCDGWAFDDVLPYFKKAENHADRNNSFHGSNGPLGVRRGDTENELFDTFIKAGAAAGYPISEDFNGEQQEGFGRYDFTIKKGRRQSASVAYINSIRDRQNLTVTKRAHATKIIFNGNKAVGVEYKKFGSYYKVFAAKEIILSLGTINTPSLLQASGVGAAQELKDLGVEIISDLPGVGKNLQDHVAVYVQHLCKKPITIRSLFKPHVASLALLEAMFFGTGPAASFPLEGGGFIKTRSELDLPDVQFHFLPGLGPGMGGIHKHGFFSNICQLRPQSRGWVRASCKTNERMPLIHTNFLAVEDDIRTIRDGVKVLRKVFSQSVFDELRGEEGSPGVDISSDVELDAWIRETAETIYHPVGTCKMGVDKMAVVDPKLKVKGVTNLSVSDASIMPTLIGGNTNAPAIMIGEKASDLILERTQKTNLE